MNASAASTCSTRGWSATTAGAELDTEGRAGIEGLLRESVTKEKLKQLASQHLGRNYRVADDGHAIARLMRHADIASEIRQTLPAIVTG